jgi:hypothetical protein
MSAPRSARVTRQLAELYQVPEPLGRHWVVDGELLLLLDGLDEIPDRRHRVGCVQAISQFSRFGRVARVSTGGGRPVRRLRGAAGQAPPGDRGRGAAGRGAGGRADAGVDLH